MHKTVLSLLALIAMVIVASCPAHLRAQTPVDTIYNPTLVYSGIP